MSEEPLAYAVYVPSGTLGREEGYHVFADFWDAESLASDLFDDENEVDAAIVPLYPREPPP